MSYNDKSDLILTQAEADMVLSSLGYKKSGGRSREWRGHAKCHGGDNKHGFSFRYDKGTAVCWTKGCFDQGTDIYGVVEHELGLNFYYAKRHVEGIIGRKLEDGFDNERSADYQEFLMRHINSVRSEDDQEDKYEQVRWVSEELWKIYAANKHPYWQERGFSEDTIDYFGCGYNPENNRVTIPIFDLKPDGSSSVVAIKQRIASDDSSLVSDDNPKYLHDSYNAGEVLFNLQNAIYALQDPYISARLRFPGLILNEGNLDVMMGHQLGHPNFVGTGSNFLTEGQARLIERHTDQILIIPDEDEKNGEWRGGRLIKSAKELLGMTTTIYVSRLRPFKDTGSLVGEDAAGVLACVIDNRWRI